MDDILQDYSHRRDECFECSKQSDKSNLTSTF
jgi:hypothetical protein